VLALEDHRLLAKEALAEAMSFMPNQAAKAATMMNGTQMKPAFCSHSRASPSRTDLAGRRRARRTRRR
jgi:hypothetical protein